MKKLMQAALFLSAIGAVIFASQISCKKDYYARNRFHDISYYREYILCRISHPHS
jgi:hypothetical protein